MGGNELTLRVDGLTKDFGERRVVSDVTFEVARGGAFGLLGPNGAGKTTIIRLLNGLLAPTAGNVELFGAALTPRTADRLRERVGVQTDTNLYESLSVNENLRAWGALYGMRPAAIDARIPEVLEVLGLADRRASLVGELSKGMRQKVAIARAILHEPELLFLDEPTAGLDPESAAELISYLRELIRVGDTTVVLTTHQLHGLESLCDLPRHPRTRAPQRRRRRRRAAARTLAPHAAAPATRGRPRGSEGGAHRGRDTGCGCR